MISGATKFDKHVWEDRIYNVWPPSLIFDKLIEKMWLGFVYLIKFDIQSKNQLFVMPRVILPVSRKEKWPCGAKPQ